MKNYKTIILILTFSFFFATVPNEAYAVSTVTNSTVLHKENKGIGEKVSGLFKKIADKIDKRIERLKDEKPSLFWLWATLLILGGMLLGIILVFLGIAAAFTSNGGALALVLLVLGFILPVVLLFFAFRPLLRKHFKAIGKEITNIKVNVLAFLLSLTPGIIATLSFYFL